MTPPRFPNSAFVRAPERLVLRDGRWKMLDIPIRYGRFDHPIGGRCLVDTGYSRRVTSGRRSIPLSLYASILSPKLTNEALPAAAPEIDTILLTHLHADHISALNDYPAARLYADGGAVGHFLAASRVSQVRHGMFAELLPRGFSLRLISFSSLPLVEAPLGLGPARDVFGDGSVLAVHLPGHMKGHTGIVWTQFDPPILYAADAEWLRAAVMEDRQPGAPARWILDDPAAGRETAARIAGFANAGGRVVFCHDPEPLT